MVEFSDLICKCSSNFQLIGLKLRILEILPLFTFWSMLTFSPMVTNLLCSDLVIVGFHFDQSWFLSWDESSFASCARTIIPHYEPCAVSCAPFLKSPKWEAMDKVSCAKRQRKVMTLDKKIELFHQLAWGGSAAFVGRHYVVNDCRWNLIHCSLPHS